LQQDLDEAGNNVFDSPLINLAEVAILMQALPDTPQIREIQRLTRDALRQIGKQNPTPSVSHNSRTPAKQKGHQEANQGNHPRGQPRPRYQEESYHADPSRSHGRYPNDTRDIINAKRHGRQQHQLEEDKKKKDKQDDEDGDKDGTMGFQQPANRVTMIYGGDSSFNRRN